MVTLLVAGCGSESLAPDELDPVAQPVVDGTLATLCQWPTAVTIRSCTATLVHPKLVTLAGHCLEDGDFPSEVLFGEDDSRPARKVAVQTCKVYPGFEPGETDAAYCILRTEVNDVPITPVIMGCEADFLIRGNKLFLVGFGFTSAKSGGTAGKKRWAEVPILRQVANGQSIEVGMGTQASCPGDSGGPLYAKLADGTFRAVGAASITAVVDDECAPPSTYTLLHKFVPWIEMNAGIDITPCHDADGKWNPGPNCGGFATAADRSNGTWADGCNAGSISGASSTCGGMTDASFDVRPPAPEGGARDATAEAIGPMGDGARDAASDRGGSGGGSGGGAGSSVAGSGGAAGSSGGATGGPAAGGMSGTSGSGAAGSSGRGGSSAGASGSSGRGPTTGGGGTSDPVGCACRVTNGGANDRSRAWTLACALGVMAWFSRRAPKARPFSRGVGVAVRSGRHS